MKLIGGHLPWMALVQACLLVFLAGLGSRDGKANALGGFAPISSSDRYFFQAPLGKIAATRSNDGLDLDKVQNIAEIQEGRPAGSRPPPEHIHWLKGLRDKVLALGQYVRREEGTARGETDRESEEKFRAEHSMLWTRLDEVRRMLEDRHSMLSQYQSPQNRLDPSVVDSLRISQANYDQVEKEVGYLDKKLQEYWDVAVGNGAANAASQEADAHGDFAQFASQPGLRHRTRRTTNRRPRPSQGFDEGLGRIDRGPVDGRDRERGPMGGMKEW